MRERLDLELPAGTELLRGVRDLTLPDQGKPQTPAKAARTDSR